MKSDKQIRDLVAGGQWVGNALRDEQDQAIADRIGEVFAGEIRAGYAASTAARRRKTAAAQGR